MAFGSRCCWAALCVVVVVVLLAAAAAVVPAAASSRYVVRRTAAAFGEAAAHCSPGGLTTLATQREVAEVLGAIAASPPPPPGDFVFWIGLKKDRKECVVPSLPLRGFRWVEDGGQETQVSRWAEEPQQTCTSVRCAALKGSVQGASVTTWGLVPVSCKNSYQFVCKVPGGETAGLPGGPEGPGGPGGPQGPATPEPEPETPEPPPTPQTQEPTTRKLEPETLRPSGPTSAVIVPTTSRPEPPAPEPEQTKVDPEPEPEPEPVPEPSPVPGSGPPPGSASSCQTPVIPGARSLSPDPEDGGRVRVECWSSVQLDLSCEGQPAAWRTADGSPADFDAVCRACAAGFRKDASGHCEDVDECAAAAAPPCRHACLNTRGSFSCVCADRGRLDDGASSCGDDADATAAPVEKAYTLSGILIPVLIAVAALAVLVTVVAVTVKCCLARRSKKHAIKKAEKMGGLDSFEAANEKAAA